MLGNDDSIIRRQLFELEKALKVDTHVNADEYRKRLEDKQSYERYRREFMGYFEVEGARSQTNTLAAENERLKHMIDRFHVNEQQFRLKLLEEEHFRNTNPAVKDAWEQYQTVLRLAKND